MVIATFAGSKANVTTIIIRRVHSKHASALTFTFFLGTDERQAHHLNFSHIQSMDILEAEYDFVVSDGFFQTAKTTRLIA